MKVLVATEKPFAKAAVNGIREIVEKNGTPDIEKKIVEGTGDEAQESDTSEGKVGDVVDYKVTVEIQPGHSGYVVTDTFSKGLTYNDDLVITLEGVAVTQGEGTYTATSSTSTETGETILTINFDDNYVYDTLTTDENGAAINSTLILTYSATINEDAVIVDAGNPNTVKLTYDNDKTLDDTVVTYTYGIDIFKYTKGASEDEKKPLAGAKFELKDSENNVVKFSKVENSDPSDHNVYIVDEDGDAELETPESGYIYLKGLAAGVYKLTETKEPSGYNKLKGDVTITVTAVKDSNGELAGTYTVKAEYDGNEMEVGSHSGHVYGSKNQTVDEIDILNNSGTELPSTGGVGTYVFTIAGTAIIATAMILFFLKRRKNMAEE